MATHTGWTVATDNCIVTLVIKKAGSSREAVRDEPTFLWPCASSLADLRGARGALHQHGDGHRADAAGTGVSNRHFLWLSSKLTSPTQTVALFLGGVGLLVHANVDDGGAGLDPVAHLSMAARWQRSGYGLAQRYRAGSSLGSGRSSRWRCG